MKKKVVSEKFNCIKCGCNFYATSVSKCGREKICSSCLSRPDVKKGKPSLARVGKK